jgi:hypothetical protein
MMVRAVLFVAAIAAALMLACGASSTTSAKRPNPADFVSRIDNPWYPLIPGTTFVYTGVKEGKKTRTVLTVTHATKVILGVHCTVLHDNVYVNGHLSERTTDWYAQDKKGSVWYFGESTAELNAKGKVISTEGSWQAGASGAQAGIFMVLHPKVGQQFRQEYYKGHAEDHFKVLSLSATVHTPAASSSHALLTTEWTPLEPGVIDSKLYVRGVGNVKEESVKGSVEKATLISVKRS